MMRMRMHREVELLVKAGIQEVGITDVNGSLSDKYVLLMTRRFLNRTSRAVSN